MNDKAGRDTLESRTQGTYNQRNINEIPGYTDGRSLGRPPDTRIGAASSYRESLTVPNMSQP